MMPSRDAFRRVNVVGSSGSGKSTFARELAAIMACPHVEIDALHWKPEWEASSDEELTQRLEAATAGEAWVLDGNYSRFAPVKWRNAQAVIWLDLPYWLIVTQVTWRTIRRSVTRQELWNGNRESLVQGFFSKDSVILWSMTNLSRMRRVYEAAMAAPENAHIRFVRLRSHRETRRFLENLR